MRPMWRFLQGEWTLYGGNRGQKSHSIKAEADEHGFVTFVLQRFVPETGFSSHDSLHEAKWRAYADLVDRDNLTLAPGCPLCEWSFLPVPCQSCPQREARGGMSEGLHLLADVVTPEIAAEARRCLPHVEDEGVRYLLQRIADCYPAPDEPTLPMGDGE